jgi:hypothetical protein
MVQLRLKLSEENSFPTEQAKMRYTIGHLTGPALDQVVPNVTATGITFANVEAMIQTLERAFDDPDRKGTAQRKLEGLKQTNKDFATYYAEFQCYVAELDWNESAKKAQLRRGLSNELKDALILMDEPEDIDAFVILLQKLDSRIRARRAERPHNPSATAIPSKTLKPAVATTTLAPHPTSTNSGHYGPAPMDLSAGRRRLTEAEKLHRLRSGLCLYCGGSGHMAANCPYKKKPVKAAEVELTPRISEENAEEESKN